MILIDIDMPIDCNHCLFSSKTGSDYRCIAIDKSVHPSWVEKSSDRPLRPIYCPLKEINKEQT